MKKNPQKRWGTTTSSPIHNLPEDAVPAIPKEDVKSNHSQTFEISLIATKSLIVRIENLTQCMSKFA
ncbi:hypothetical protein III_05308 [Bacillus mycoides]|uniref:Uncharacterized protein n=1 Tax=Bacillus mycoides TaxID=1405 RepID=A0ABC9QX66_BACMY|nr:hypothetical protein III_05308 [Bacillus mycoides]